MPATGLTYLLTDVVDIPGPHHQAQEASELVKRLGVVEMEPWPRLPLQAEHLQAADQWLTEQGARPDRPICALHLTAFYPTKIWPLERFLAVAKHLKQTLDAQILIVGGNGDVEIAREFAGKFDGPVMIAAGVPLSLSAGLLSRCAVLVGNDSGPAHVAAYVGRPVVVLFGRGNPTVFRPLSPKVTILASAQPCDPGCHKICVRGASWCMLQHSPEVVIETVERIMDQKWPPSEVGVYLTRSAPESVPAARQPDSN
jgi:ADP-heptose:LPS heptosyltransferase